MGNTPSALLVEDDPLVQELLEYALTDAAISVTVASNGAQALTELQTNPSRFKAVITDINLGNGPDGWDIGQSARKFVPCITAVYMSGDSGHEWPSKGVPNSIFVSKPFAPDRIIAAVIAPIYSFQVASAAP